jgi:hypothetical protein
MKRTIFPANAGSSYAMSFKMIRPMHMINLVPFRYYREV